MVAQLFAERRPLAEDLVLDPGCGPGAFIEGVIRWAQKHDAPVPKVVGIELDPERAASARERFKHLSSVTIVEADFLLDDFPLKAEYIIGNPPYVGITHFSEDEKSAFRSRFTTATGRFDLYMLFFERAVELLATDGRLVFITPEKYTYVASAESLRRLMASHQLVKLELLPEDTFEGLTTYPLVSTLDEAQPTAATTIVSRDGAEHSVELSRDGSSWRASFHSGAPLADTKGWPKLSEFCLRISCGLATGADSIYVVKPNDVPPDAAHLSWPTLAGRGLDYNQAEVRPTHRMLVPYDPSGSLIAEKNLGGLLPYLSAPETRKKLEKRTCAARKPWYAFHDSAPMTEILRPKILCKDITDSPMFWLDAKGTVVPRHTIYYIVPMHSSVLLPLFDYLGSDFAQDWIARNAQRAANGFIRMQSTMLKKLPIPPEVAAEFRRLEESSNKPHGTPAKARDSFRGAEACK